MAELAAAHPSVHHRLIPIPPGDSPHKDPRSNGRGLPRRAFWHRERGARVLLVENRDGTFTPREVVVMLHSAGMLVERVIAVPPEIQARAFLSKNAAAEAALRELDLERFVVV